VSQISASITNQPARAGELVCELPLARARRWLEHNQCRSLSYLLHIAILTAERKNEGSPRV
jgi:hypothetical protein